MFPARSAIIISVYMTKLIKHEILRLEDDVDVVANAQVVEVAAAATRLVR